MSLEDGAPWISVELDGLVLHVPMGEGKWFTLPLSNEGAYALLGELAERVTALKTDAEFQKKVATFVAEKAVGWLAKKIGQ